MAPRHVYLVEHDPQALRALYTNIRHCDATESVTVITASFPDAVRRLPKNLQADMLFLDPPYASDMGETTLAALEGYGVLAPQGTIIWQHSTQHAVPPRYCSCLCGTVGVIAIVNSRSTHITVLIRSVCSVCIQRCDLSAQVELHRMFHQTYGKLC